MPLSSFLGLVIFYVSLFFALIGIFMLAGVGLRALVGRGTPVFRHLGISLRQAVLFALLLVGSLLLQGNRLFNWWNALFFVAGLSLLEFFFLMRSQRSARP